MNLVRSGSVFYVPGFGPFRSGSVTVLGSRFGAVPSCFCAARSTPRPSCGPPSRARPRRSDAVPSRPFWRH
eukprot:3903468-Pyramimonas_sp.AAC.1